uniref:Double jelly roll-like domain-containing protein n=1 Tax=Trichogramma kaykai TaxID=54128 RepID=A0ABD2WBU4_9HYME
MTRRRNCADSRSLYEIASLVQARQEAVAGVVPPPEESKITLKKIEWCMPTIQLSNQDKIKLLKQMDKNAPIKIPFRSWQLFEWPTISAATRQHGLVCQDLKPA